MDYGPYFVMLFKNNITKNNINPEMLKYFITVCFTRRQNRDNFHFTNKSSNIILGF